MKRLAPMTFLFILLFSSLHCTHAPRPLETTPSSPPSARGPLSSQSPHVATLPASPKKHSPTATTSKSTSNAASSSSRPRRSTAASDWLATLPERDASEYLADIQKKVNAARADKNSEQNALMAQRIAKYVAFVMADYESGTLKTKPKSVVTKALIKRLFESSPQFILCADIEDYECLEATPEITPTLKHRQEDPTLGLGLRRVVQSHFQNQLEYHLNTQVFIPQSQVDLKKTMAAKLESKINQITDPKNDSISMALYGIDDIVPKGSNRGSLGGIYLSLIDKIDRGILVQGVFDHSGLNAHAPKPALMTYVKPNSPQDLKKWVLSPLDPSLMPVDPKTGKPKKMLPSDSTNLNFQYDEGTQGLIEALARGATTDEEAEGRLEWKNVGAIMHNKFFVFKKGPQYSVWTGTANVARTCMGTERNSNLGVYIQNNEIAQVFLEEFKEMYEFIEPTPKNKEKNFVGLGGGDIPHGRFHTAKSPNTHRYFHFSQDGTDVRVYFSPTDDAEHRAILPMLHSAREGDTLRLSMFGAGGLELARALQWASARGVKIEIIADTPTSRGVNQFLGAKGEATLFNVNPFNPSATIALKNNDVSTEESWAQNHQKVGVLIRKNGIAEQIIFGSQNWSGAGNDKSDENLIALRNPRGLKIAEDFDKHFREYLWPRGEVSVLKVDEAPTGEDAE